LNDISLSWGWGWGLLAAARQPIGFVEPTDEIFAIAVHALEMVGLGEGAEIAADVGTEVSVLAVGAANNA